MFRSHVQGKSKLYVLTELDLLYASNFKGGNSSICELPSSIEDKLKRYQEILQKIVVSFGQFQLRDLDVPQVDALGKMARSFLDTTLSEGQKIDGFGPAYASAVLAAHLPDLLPVIDKWVLNGAGLLKAQKKVPVENIETHYEEFLRLCWLELNKHKQSSLRQLDFKWYTK